MVILPEYTVKKGVLPEMSVAKINSLMGVLYFIFLFFIPYKRDSESDPAIHVTYLSFFFFNLELWYFGYK